MLQLLFPIVTHGQSDAMLVNVAPRLSLFQQVLPGCTERTGVALCFLMHSGNSCQRHRTASAPSAARCHSDMPEHRIVQGVKLSSAL